jgi:dTMP kinase
MYLDGEFGGNPSDVGPYAASTFYAVDRYASYKKDWGEAHSAGEIIIADRYTMSNMIHQGAKLKDEDELREYIDWLCDLEFVKLKLPRPDKVIFLDMPMEFRAEFLSRRAAKAENANRIDIHERDLEYMTAANTFARKIAEQQGWRRVSIVKDGALREVEDVHNEVYSIVKAAIT